jgi:transcriptional regulator with XRE-family HTH domain
MAASKTGIDAPLSDEETERLTDAFMKRIGARIRELREMQGHSFTSFADEHGINRSQICRVENGQQNLTAWTAVRIASALGVRPWDFYVPRELSDLRPKRRRRSPPSPAELDKASRAFQKQIGTRVRALRDLQGMSLMTLETFSGVAGWTLQNIESGKANPRASTAIRIADAIGVQPHELYIPTEQSGIRPTARPDEDDDA